MAHRYMDPSRHTGCHWQVGCCTYYWHKISNLLIGMGLFFQQTFVSFPSFYHWYHFFNLHKQIDILDGTNANQRPLHLGQSRDNTFEVAKVARSLRCLISEHREHVEIVMYMYTARVVSSAG